MGNMNISSIRSSELPFRLIVVILISCVILNTPLLAWGNPPPGRWEKVAQTKPGQRMIVHTANGAKGSYIYAFLDREFLHCASERGNDIRIELDSVEKIVIPKAGKYAVHGLLFGAPAGSIVTLFTPWNGSDGPYLGMILGAGIGAVAGFLGGAAIGAPGETVYISKEKAMRDAGK